MGRLRSILSAILLPAVSLSTAAFAVVDEPGPPQVIHRTNPHGVGESIPAGSAAPSSNPISYHGGKVITTPTIYLIWYGNWNQSNGSDTAAGQQIVRDFAASVGGSPYFDINTSYSNQSYNAVISGGVSFADANQFNEFTDLYSRGKRLRDADVQQIVTNAISKKWQTVDPSGVYFVLTSSDVNEQSGFCTRYCGWHTAATPSVGHIRYSFVGNANRCLNACAIQTTSPNSNAGVDGMISVIAHELEEATTDPDLNAWYDSSGAENADKCAWTFGRNVQYTASGAGWNLQLGARQYLIQRNLNHNWPGPNGTGDYCMMDNVGQY